MIVLLLGGAPALAEEFRVTVVSILASDRHKSVDPKLTAIADEFRKRDATLTGWRIERTTAESMPLGQKKSFPLVDGVVAEVVVASHDAKDNKLKVTVRSPHAGEITYTTVPDKFFPILTRYQTEQNKERLVYAVMVRPVPAKDKDAKSDKTGAP
jgi:hypothetical protein